MENMLILYYSKANSTAKLTKGKVNILKIRHTRPDHMASKISRIRIKSFGNSK